MYSVQKHACCGCNGFVLGLGGACVLCREAPQFLWICRFNYDSTNIPPCVYDKQSLSMEMHNFLFTSPTVWHYWAFSRAQWRAVGIK